MEIALNDTIHPLSPLPGAALLVHIPGADNGKKLAACERRDSHHGGRNSAAPATLDKDKSAE